MKKLITFSAIVAFATASCTKEYKNWSVEIENPTQITRNDESIILSRDQLKPADKTKLPVVKDSSGIALPSQVDDLDGDGVWDELAFITNLSAGEKKAYKIDWVIPTEYPQFKVRTNIRYGLMVSDAVVVDTKKDMHYKESKYAINTQGYPYQMDGIAWENDKVGFRHYYDGRNCRDYFGKRVEDMVLDTVGIKPNGFPGDTYHVWADWGRDIMAVGTTFGIGGLGAWVDGERFVRLGRLATDPLDDVDSTGFSIIAEGPVRSRFALDFYGWEIEGKKVEHLRQEVTIWAGKHGYENRVLSSALPANVKLITGIPRIFNDKPLEEIKLEKSTAMLTHDYQSYNKEFIMGNALVIPNTNLTRIFDTPDTDAPLTKTWCAELNLDKTGVANYNVYAVWEHQDSLFKDRNYFIDFVKTEGNKIDNPVKVTLK